MPRTPQPSGWDGCLSLALREPRNSGLPPRFTPLLCRLSDRAVPTGLDLGAAGLQAVASSSSGVVSTSEAKVSCPDLQDLAPKKQPLATAGAQPGCPASAPGDL